MKEATENVWKRGGPFNKKKNLKADWTRLLSVKFKADQNFFFLLTVESFGNKTEPPVDARANTSDCVTVQS